MSAPVLRPYQLRAIEESAAHMAAGVDRVLIVSPTGSGKTVVMAEIIRRMRAKGKRALFLAAARELILQTSQKLADVDVPHGIIMAGHEPDYSHPVQVASIQTLRRRALPPADLVVIDEADLARARTYETILSEYPNAFVLGATASPWRTDGKGLGELFKALVVAATPAQLMAEGHLCPYSGYVFEPLDVSGIATKAGDYDEKELGRRATDTAAGQKLAGDVVAKYLQYGAGKRAVCFAVNVRHSEMLAERFIAAGIPAEHLDGTMSMRQRDAILERLRSGETHVVTNVGVLTRGVDVPALEVCILARATQSLSLYLQMVGRVLRPSPATGKTHALILDHAGCIMRGDEIVHGLPDQDRDYSLDCDLRARQAREKREAAAPAIRQCLECYAVHPADLDACPMCGAPVVRVRQTEIAEAADVREVSLDEVRKMRPAGPGAGRVQLAYLERVLRDARERGWKPTAVGMKFKAKFGVWPPSALMREAEGRLDARAERRLSQLEFEGGVR